MRASTATLVAALLCLSASSSATTIMVDQGGGGDYATIQEGLDAAAAGDTVLILPGVYVGDLNMNLDCEGKPITVTAWTGRDPVIIECGHRGQGFLFLSGETGGTVVRGLHILHGEGGYGGGIACENASPTIQDCVIEASRAYGGGGMDISGVSTPQIIDCLFKANAAFSGGGGLRCSGSLSAPSIKGCTFEGNEARFGGGVISRGGAAPLIENCVFEGNTADYSGGIRFETGSATVTDCLFRGNHAVSGGAMGSGDYATPVLRFVTCVHNVASTRGACFANGTYADIANCTFVGGESPSGGGMFCGEPFGTMELRNSIIAFSPEGAAVTCDYIGWPTITHCCVFGNAGGDVMCGNYFDNLFEDPRFCDLPNGDLTIHEESPCMPGNNPWGELVGAHEMGCEGTVPVEDVSWGAIKAMYR